MLLSPADLGSILKSYTEPPVVCSHCRVWDQMIINSFHSMMVQGPDELQQCSQRCFKSFDSRRKIKRPEITTRSKVLMCGGPRVQNTTLKKTLKWKACLWPIITKEKHTNLLVNLVCDKFNVITMIRLWMWKNTNTCYFTF